MNITEPAKPGPYQLTGDEVRHWLDLGVITREQRHNDAPSIGELLDRFGRHPGMFFDVHLHDDPMPWADIDGVDGLMSDPLEAIRLYGDCPANDKELDVTAAGQVHLRLWWD